MGKSQHHSVGLLDREVASLLIEVFRPRMDLYAWRVDDEETAARLTAWELERRGARARAWRVGEWRPAGPRGMRRPVTPDDVALHVAGVRTLGFYPMHPDGTCNSVSADFDDHRGQRVIERDPALDFEALVARLIHERVPHLAHRSRGGRGFWVHVLPPSGTSAREARRVMHGLLDDAGVRDVAHGGTFDGLFPKQDDASVQGAGDPTSRPGNLFCLPLSRRWLANETPGSGFVGVDPDDFGAQVYQLWKARRVEHTRWSELVARYTQASPGRRIRTPATPRVRGSARPVGEGAHGAWEIALRRAGRLGRPLGNGRHALLCVNDALHTTPDGTVEGARGSCVLFPASAEHPQGFPWCAHAHCAHLTPRDWVHVVGRDVWDDACLASQGMRRAGMWLLHPGGVSTWYRDARGALVPSRRELLCEVPLWIVEDARTRRGCVRVVEAVVSGRTKRLRVPASRFASLTWLARLGVDPEAMLPATKARLVEAIERLSAPIPVRDATRAEPVDQAVDQAAMQARAHDLLALLSVMLEAASAPPSNQSSEGDTAERRCQPTRKRS